MHRQPGQEAPTKQLTALSSSPLPLNFTSLKFGTLCAPWCSYAPHGRLGPSPLDPDSLHDAGAALSSREDSCWTPSAMFLLVQSLQRTLDSNQCQLQC